mgnify:FL=1
MKEDCTSFQTKGLNVDEKLISLPLTYSVQKNAHRQKYLCTRTDSDVQGVESGSSILIVMNDCLSEFTPCYWCGFLFHVFFIGFCQNLTLRKRGGVSSHRFL